MLTAVGLAEMLQRFERVYIPAGVKCTLNRINIATDIAVKMRQTPGGLFPGDEAGLRYSLRILCSLGPHLTEHIIARKVGRN